MPQKSLPGGQNKLPERRKLWEDVTLTLIQFQGHDLPLSLAELAEQTGLRKSALLRALATAEQRGDLVRVGDFDWRRGA
ncbi:helix-turn-helix domain-containing protein [Roseomonas elaeocarpi]|uniref:Helix-turn-helix domain-containing protein n=1 Tax=Roseomonas elaeocarpi TaxID=907779 RepID=A0ABV6JWR7_9PROT